MPRSVYFSHGTRSEHLLHEDIIVESISIYGQNFYYIPRELVAKDEILGEDRLSKFKKAFAIEMYLENAEGFEGQGAFIQRFGGMMMEQSATLTVARRRWEQLVGRFGATTIPSRPNEGDLLYFPLTDGLFEIKFVQHQDPFYQIGKLFVYKLEVELFQYASERMETGVAQIDQFESLKSFSTSVVQNGIIREIRVTNRGIGYTTAPTIVIGNDWVASSIVGGGDELCYDGRRYIVTKAGTTGSGAPIHTSGFAENGSAELQYIGVRATATAVLGDQANVNTTEVVRIALTNAGSGYTSAPNVRITPTNGGSQAAAVAYIENLDNQDSFGDNNKFKEEAANILFSEDNPFGEISPYIAPSTNNTADTTTVTADSISLTADKY